jgi:hypothetical protein
MAKCSKPQAGAKFFEKFQKKFKKTLKFPKSAPLPVQDTPQSVSACCWMDKEKNFKFFKNFWFEP